MVSTPWKNLDHCSFKTAVIRPWWFKNHDWRVLDSITLLLFNLMDVVPHIITLEFEIGFHSLANTIVRREAGA